ncbi:MULTISPECIES: cytochrome c oxidase assembly protein [unclassified Lysinibacillus]|uniref:cytochrome c oxidase assembly protein n=1 Tax=unclassified Lysinibacillus TaxID=2636778 RepID=UPI00382E9C8B
MNADHHQIVEGGPSHEVFGIIHPQLIFLILFITILILYSSATVITNRNYKKWPFYRIVSFVVGILLAIIAVVGPLANRASIDFTAHMFSHLLLGMLAPLLIVLAAPMTLILRTLSTPLARGLSRILRSWLARILIHPLVTSFLNIGGLWILYTTNLYSLMHDNSLIHVIVHLHVFIAGYLFTVSIIYFDPVYHRKSFIYRAIVLIIALAGHGILSKYIYAHPPKGVPIEQAEIGSMFMYYGGDVIDAMIIFILCLQWYKAARPRDRELQNSKGTLKVN